MNVYLAGCSSKFKYDAIRKLGLELRTSEKDTKCAFTLQGSSHGVRTDCTTAQSRWGGVSLLESFYYADDWTEKTIPLLESFMLDSGAFTFMTSKASKTLNWDQYIEEYADFINRNNVSLFYELDIDSIVGYERVKQMRSKLIQLTGKQPIPVWHISRGKEEFFRMCNEFPYVALGGLAAKEFKQRDYKYIPWFISEAHKRKAKIHGLGFTNLKGLEKYHFDSVDSTSWVSGNRFGAIYKFNGRTMVKHDKPDGTRIVKFREAALNNFNEWVKFQQYAKTHL